MSMNDNNNLPGGSGRLRALLQSIGERAEDRLIQDPRYREGWDDGYAAAQRNHRLLAEALAAVYDIRESLP
jgi:hypothetical protein